MTPDIRNRLHWVDNVKAIGIFWIILRHNGRIPDVWFWAPYVDSFVMPLFFFVSGVLISDSIKSVPFGPYVKTQAVRLLTPYISVNLLSFLLWVTLIRKFGMRASIDVSPLKSFLGMFYGVYGDGWMQHNITLWFLPCLFITKILVYLVIRQQATPVKVALILSCGMAGYSFFQLFPHVRLPFSADVALTGTVFCWAGHHCRTLFYSMAPLTRRRLVPVTAISLIVNLLFVYLNGRNSFLSGDFGNSIFYFYPGAVSGIIFWICIAMLIRPNPVSTIISKNLLIIFSTHILVFPFLTGTLVFGLGVEKASLDQSYLVALFYTVVATFITIQFSLFVERYMPWAIGNFKKSIQ